MATWGKGLPGRWNSTRSPRWQSLQHMQGPARAQGAHMGPLRGGWRSETERVGPVRAQGSPEQAGLSSTCCGSTGGEMTQVPRMDEVPEGGFCSNPGWNGQPWGGGRERDVRCVLGVCWGHLGRFPGRLLWGAQKEAATPRFWRSALDAAQIWPRCSTIVQAWFGSVCLLKIPGVHRSGLFRPRLWTQNCVRICLLFAYLWKGDCPGLLR